MGAMALTNAEKQARCWPHQPLKCKCCVLSIVDCVMGGIESGAGGDDHKASDEHGKSSPAVNIELLIEIIAGMNALIDDRRLHKKLHIRADRRPDQRDSRQQIPGI